MKHGPTERLINAKFLLCVIMNNFIFITTITKLIRSMLFKTA